MITRGKGQRERVTESGREREGKTGGGGGGVVESKNRAVEGIDVPHAIYRTLSYPTAACRQQLLRR